MNGIKTIDGFAVVSRHFLRKRADQRKGAIVDLQAMAAKTNDSDAHHARTELRDLDVAPTDRLAIYKPHRWARRYYVVIDNGMRIK